MVEFVKLFLYYIFYFIQETSVYLLVQVHIFFKIFVIHFTYLLQSMSTIKLIYKKDLDAFIIPQGKYVYMSTFCIWIHLVFGETLK